MSTKRGELVEAKVRPFVIITSNAERELPDAFLRRCLFHFISFPDREQMQKIVDVHHPNIDKILLDNALEQILQPPWHEGNAQETEYKVN